MSIGPIDGKYGFKHSLPALKAKRLYRVNAKVVVHDDSAAIAAAMEGKVLVRWQGKLSSLPATKRPRLQVGFWKSEGAYTVARLRMLTGKAVRLP